MGVDPQRGVQVMQALDTHDRAMAKQQAEELALEREALLRGQREEAATAQQFLTSGEAVSGVPLDPQAQRGMAGIVAGQAVREGRFPQTATGPKTIAERAATGDPIAREALRLQAQERMSAAGDVARMQDRFALEREERAAQRKTAAEQRAEQVTVRKEQRAPLTGAAGRRVAELNAAIQLGQEMEKNFEPGFVGFADATLGAARQATGRVTKQEVKFRRDTINLVETYLRAMSGAQINEAEVRRIAAQAPKLSDPNNVFRAKLEGFLEHMERLRDQMISTGTVPRAFLATQQPTSGGPASPAVGQPLGIDTTIEGIRQQLRDTGMTDAEIDAALGR